MPVDTARAGTGRHAPPDVVWALPLVTAGGALIAAGKLCGGPLARPVLSIGLVASGFIVATGLHLFRNRIRQATGEPGWLLAAALVVLGFAAALLCDSAGALVALDGLHAGLSVAAGN
jgi:hypothetical protein